MFGYYIRNRFAFLLLCTYLSIANSATVGDWRLNCQVVDDYSTKLIFTAILHEPKTLVVGTNRRQLLNLFAKFQLDDVPQIKKKLVSIIKVINKAQPFKEIYGNGDADITISNKLNNKIQELFNDINALGCAER